MWRPKLAITMGDVAGIGPEVIVRACTNASIRRECQPIVVGHPVVLERAARLLAARAKIISVNSLDEAACADDVIPCWNPSSDDVLAVGHGELDRRAGRAN
jgi:4-hydroxy-L-threonine phosphate dehydrogenase PdxA